MTEQLKRDWRPSASLENLKLRARILSDIRAFFAQRDVMEVETPTLSVAAASDPYLDSFESHYLGPLAPQGLPLYLQTSPEYHMKRLLAAGSGSIYQIGKAFRNGEAGDRHNPEFTLLEWYRLGFDHLALMDEVADLVRLVLGFKQVQRITYQQLFIDVLDIDPFSCDIDSLQACLAQRNVHLPQMPEASLDDWLGLVMSQLIEPAMGAKPLLVYDFPVSQAMLARVRQGDIAVAERFELYVNGIELANGFHELADVAEQQRRFQENIKQRQMLGLAVSEIDTALLDALNAGLPDCAGVALGIDRLVMLAAKSDRLADVIAFPILKA